MFLVLSRKRHITLRSLDLWKNSVPLVSRLISQKSSNARASVSKKELEKFNKLAYSWWDANGPFKALHSMNPMRCSFIRDFSCCHFGLDTFSARPLIGLTCLDVGCGGGLLSESLYRMGGKVLGIDLVPCSINIAKSHAASLFPDLLPENLRYQETSAESLLEQNLKFDIVIASEVMEHVKNTSAFLKTLIGLMSPGGTLFISTINRTLLSYLGTIVAAERVMRLVPVGTHNWSKYLTPQELAMMAEEEAIDMKHLAGLIYNPINNRWTLQKDISINYIASFARKRSSEQIAVS